MKFVQTEIPESKSRSEKDSRYEQSVKGKDRRETEKGYRYEKRLQSYLDRPFIAWDGEGINESDGSHTYVLLANSVGDSIANRNGLATKDILEMYLACSHLDAIHVVYGGGYDINMSLKDLSRDELQELYEYPSIRWQGYHLSWRRGKSLNIRKGKRSVMLYDVLPFFQTTYVNACDEYLGGDWESREEIIREKQNRGTFDYANIDAITEYNKAELRNLVRLCNELRERLWKVDIRIKRWDGPGAIAAALFQKYGVKRHKADTPEIVGECARYAYAGGRFEIIRKGHSTTGAFQYDIRSAYPSAIRYLPCLSHGKWSHVTAPQSAAPFGVYRVHYDDGTDERITDQESFDEWHRNLSQSKPFFKRTKDGTVHFPGEVINWYWTPEAQLALDIGEKLLEGWEYHTDCDCAPFSFVENLYNKRAALKKAKDGAHVGLKLGLNSMYGKLAQQMGWAEGPPLRIPPYHCLEWAGFVTSHCRAQVFRAALLAPDDVIAFETDAIFSRVPLPLKLGERLGEWDLTEYASLTYLKSGQYFGTLTDGTEVVKSRGIDKASLSRAAVVEALEREAATGEQTILPASQTRFIGLGQALNQNFDLWTHWVTSDRQVNTKLDGKRIDVLTDEFYKKVLDDGWGETMPTLIHALTPESVPFTVEWINPNPDIKSDDELTVMELRLERGESEWQAVE